MKQQTATKQAAGRLGSSIAFHIFIVLMILYALYHCVASFSDRVVTDTVTSGIAHTTLSGEAVLLRDETVLTAPGGSALCSYPNAAGAKVNTRSVLAQLYPIAGEPQDIAQKQSTLTALDRQIALAGRYGTASELLSALPTLRTETSDELLRVAALATDGAPMREIETHTDTVLLLLRRIRALTGEGQSLTDMLASLQTERTSLLGAAAHAGRSLMLSDVAPDMTGGYFYHAESVDGYEDIFRHSLTDELTVSQFESLMSATRRDYGTGVTVVGKVAHSYEWSIALPLDASAAESLELGTRYPVTFHDGQALTVDMTLERIVGDPNDATVLALLSCSVAPSGFTYPRFAHVSLMLETVEGYRIPETALIEKNGESGVYVLDGGRVSYRSVHILYRGNGFVIVYAPTAAERESETDDTYHADRYVVIRDTVITEGDNLYDGKYID